MPEASIHKHCKLTASEHDVRAHSTARQVESVVLAEAQAPCVKGFTEVHFRFGVGAPHSGHVARALGGRDLQPNFLLSHSRTAC